MNNFFAVLALFLLQFSFIGAKKDLETITSKVFFDVEIGGKAAGRIVMGLFGILIDWYIDVVVYKLILL